VSIGSSFPKMKGEKLVALGAANDETRSLLLGMLEDLANRIREESIRATDAAAVLRELAPFCRPRLDGEGSDLGDLRALLRSRELRERVPGFFEFHSKVAQGKAH
jgi:hypothetical protein